MKNQKRGECTELRVFVLGELFQPGCVIVAVIRSEHTHLKVKRRVHHLTPWESQSHTVYCSAYIQYSTLFSGPPAGWEHALQPPQMNNSYPSVRWEISEQAKQRDKPESYHSKHQQITQLPASLFFFFFSAPHHKSQNRYWQQMCGVTSSPQEPCAQNQIR